MNGKYKYVYRNGFESWRYRIIDGYFTVWIPALREWQKGNNRWWLKPYIRAKE